MIRGKIFALSLCAIGVVAGIFGLDEMWLDPFDWDMFLKIIGTIMILGTEISFLVAVNYTLPQGRRKWPLLGLVALSVLAMTLITGQIWMQVFDWNVFLKLLASMAIACGLAGFLLAMAPDSNDNNHPQGRNPLD